MSNVKFGLTLCRSSHYQSILLPLFKLVLPKASIGYVQTMSNDHAQASPLCHS
jgi:hypothetical protein